MTGIDCPIDLFAKQEAEVARITGEINRAKTAGEKAPHAQELIAAVDVLLACEAHDADNRNCRLCRDFSGLRRKTATLVVDAAGLAGSDGDER